MRKGDIVKFGFKEGMVVYFRSNQEIGVNFSHYHILKYQGLDEKELKLRVYAMGADEMFSREELTEIK